MIFAPMVCVYIYVYIYIYIYLLHGRKNPQGGREHLWSLAVGRLLHSCGSSESNTLWQHEYDTINVEWFSVFSKELHLWRHIKALFVANLTLLRALFAFVFEGGSYVLLACQASLTIRAALKGTDLRGRTLSVVSRGFRREAAIICGFLRPPNAWISMRRDESAKHLWLSTRICRLGSVCDLRSVSLKRRPDLLQAWRQLLLKKQASLASRVHQRRFAIAWCQQRRWYSPDWGHSHLRGTRGSKRPTTYYPRKRPFLNSNWKSESERKEERKAHHPNFFALAMFEFVGNLQFETWFADRGFGTRNPFPCQRFRLLFPIFPIPPPIRKATKFWETTIASTPFANFWLQGFLAPMTQQKTCPE